MRSLTGEVNMGVWLDNFCGEAFVKSQEDCSTGYRSYPQVQGLVFLSENRF